MSRIKVSDQHTISPTEIPHVFQQNIYYRIKIIKKINIIILKNIFFL